MYAIQQHTSARTALQIDQPSPAIRRIQATLNPQDQILLIGAGHGRNARWLRDQGHPVYATDPYNGDDGVDGWVGVTSKPVPWHLRFEVGVTCFVLNVVPWGVARQIRMDMAERCKVRHHIVRGTELENQIQRGNYEQCGEGYVTSRGYQRVVRPPRGKNINVWASTQAYVAWREV